MRYRDVAPRLFENGWRSVIPLTNGKAPTIKWGPIQHRDMTEATLDHFLKNYGWAPRVGLVFGPCRSLVAVDIDIEDLPTMKRVLLIMESHGLISPFVRIGKKPKGVALFRGNVASAKPHPIEIFGSSGQVAIFGEHPTAGKPYEWIMQSILDYTPDDLPLATQEQIDAFLSECKAHVVPRTVTGEPIDWHDSERLALERRMYGIDAAAQQIAGVSDGTRHLVMRSVTGWLVNEGYDPQDIGEFVEKWFPANARTKEWSSPGAMAAHMAYSAIAKWGDKDWELKDDK